MQWIPRTRSTAAAAVLAGLLLSFPAPASARLVADGGGPVAAASNDAAHTLYRSPRGTVTPGLLCQLVDGLRLCSHGDDAAFAGASTARGGPDTPPSSTASTRIGCYRSGPHVQAVYARPAGAPDRYTASLASFRAWAGAVEKAVDDSAHKTGGARHVRFASVPSGDSCVLSILRVTLPPASFGSFAATVHALRDVGLDDDDEKYLVWTDAKGYCGVASSYEDETKGPDNLNNGRFPSYARIDRTCWGKVETHELLHMLGAVQRGAPHATQGMHCHDGSDVMCYADGTRGSRQTSVCPAGHSRLLDCRGDDYFSTAAPAGSWLAAHWNTASSAFLARGWTDPPPTRSAPPAHAAPARPSPSPSPSRAPSPRPSPESGPVPQGSPLPRLPLVLPTRPVGR